MIFEARIDSVIGHAILSENSTSSTSTTKGPTTSSSTSTTRIGIRFKIFFISSFVLSFLISAVAAVRSFLFSRRRRRSFLPLQSSPPPVIPSSPPWEKELAAVKINAADVDIIANELELDKKVAERTLRCCHSSFASLVWEPGSVREYLVNRYTAYVGNPDSLFILPYNTVPVGKHWLLLAIDPIKEVVYFLNSVDGEWTNYPAMKETVDQSIQIFRSQRDAQVPRSKSSNITWIKVQCLLQNNDVDCEYFCLRFMKEILHKNQVEIPSTYFDDLYTMSYTKVQVEEVKEEICQFYVENRLF
ncbi:unnamed protein product [Vicia faba]|uniref:Nascent polypeptide-associated complex subunit alpha-like UBA domain-containing protein n=1 Tax=Vicia faba TaxID=3906 RepID=A0AAV0ZXK9_VICFA|nr:unnamed protein product [Vicia faba]